jgi:hypothetical protein
MQKLGIKCHVGSYTQQGPTVEGGAVAEPAAVREILVSSVQYHPNTSPHPVVLNEICKFSLDSADETLHDVRCYHLPLVNRSFSEEFRFLHHTSQQGWHELPDEDDEEIKYPVPDHVYIVNV